MVVEDVGCDGYVMEGDCFFILGYDVVVIHCNRREEVCPGGVVGGWEKQVDVDSLATDAELLFLRDA